MNDKKTVLITGADGALGREIVRRLVQDAWHIHACVHSEQAALNLQQAFPETYGKTLTTFTADITKPAEVEGFVKSTPHFDALAHIAGGFRSAATFAENTDQDFQFLFDLNLRSTFLLLRAVMPLMSGNGLGAIVTIGAKPAIHPAKVNAAYNASKAAVVSLTLTAAEEGRPHNVRANVIVPAVIRTEANRQWAASDKEAAHWTPPEDIADTVAFLLSEQGKGVTGTVIPMYNKITS